MSLVVMNRVTSFGRFRLHPAQRLLLDGRRPVCIGGRAMDILICLVERAGELVSKQDLMNWAWPNTTVEESNIRVQMSILRRALDDGRNGNRFILNIRGRGYWFAASSVTRNDSSAALMASLPPAGYGANPPDCLSPERRR